jgi:hypothetical protein
MNNPDEILSMLENSLKAFSVNQTMASLGNRQAYLGMSDLAHGLTCPRAVIANKLQPNAYGLDLKTLLTLERGHWLEHGIETALKATGVKLMPQLEISVTHHGTPVKAHLDLTLVSNSGDTVTVLELKSMARMKEAVLESHEAQLSGQISLLQAFWDQQVFKTEGSIKFKSFPQLVHETLTVKLAKHPVITGYVLTVSPNEAKAFGPYVPDQIRLAEFLAQAESIWTSLTDINQGLASLDQVPWNKDFSPLCDFCRFNRDCPKFAGDTDLALETELSDLANLKAQKSSLEDEIQDRENQLKAIAVIMGKTNQWIASGKYRFKVSTQNGRQTLDQEILKSNLITLVDGLDEMTLNDLIASSKKEGQPFERFSLSRIN